MEIIIHRKHVENVAHSERVASAVCGSLLLVTGLTHRSSRGMLATLAGGELLRRALTGRSFAYELLGVRTAPLGQGAATTSLPYELGLRVEQSVIVDRPRPEVYGFWCDLSNLPRFFRHIESVRETGGKRSHWVIKAAGGARVEWDATIHNQVENRLIAWRTLRGTRVEHAGSVRFRDVRGGQGTEVRVLLQYNPPVGAVGALIAKLWGGEPTAQIAEDLRRLKQILEARQDWEVEEASQESFPASDAPAFTP